MWKTNIADRLAALRAMVTPRLSQREASRLADLSEAHVGHIESGFRADLSMRTVQGLSRLFGVSSDLLTQGKGKPPAEDRVNQAVRSCREKVTDAA